MADAPFTKDHFISRRGEAAALAKEIADILEAEGQSTIIQNYDARHGQTFTAFMHDALKAAQHFIGVHTDGYDTNTWTKEELMQFLAAPDREKAARRLGVLRCDEAEPRGLLAGVV